MGLYALAGREPNKVLQAKIKGFIKQNIQRRREYIKMCMASNPPQTLLPHVLPDYTLAFSVAVLTHDPNFTNPTDFGQLREIEACLWFVLEPLAESEEKLKYCFYKELFSRLKHHKSVYQEEDPIVNKV